MRDHTLSTTSTVVGMGSCSITILVPYILAPGAPPCITNGAIYGKYWFWVSITFSHRPEEAIMFVMVKVCALIFFSFSEFWRIIFLCVARGIWHRVAAPYFNFTLLCTLFSYIGKTVQCYGYVGLLYFTVQSNNSSCLVLILHRQLGNHWTSEISANYDVQTETIIFHCKMNGTIFHDLHWRCWTSFRCYHQFHFLKHASDVK